MINQNLHTKAEVLKYVREEAKKMGLTLRVEISVQINVATNYAFYKRRSGIKIAESKNLNWCLDSVCEQDYLLSQLAKITT